MHIRETQRIDYRSLMIDYSTKSAPVLSPKMEAATPTLFNASFRAGSERSRMDPKDQDEQTQWSRRAGPVARGPWSVAREPQKTKQTQFPCFWAKNGDLGEKQTQSGR